MGTHPSFFRGEQASVGGGNGMILLVPLGALADVKQFDPFPPVAGAPFAYPGAYDQREAGTMWMPEPHPYAASEPWPPATEVDVSAYPWLPSAPGAV